MLLDVGGFMGDIGDRVVAFLAPLPRLMIQVN